MMMHHSHGGHGDFEEIGHAGGKIEFLRRDGGISMRYSHSSPGPFALFFIAASYDGVPIHFVGMRGIGVPFDQIHPSILVPIASDREGMWGAVCPSCSMYFRTNVGGATLRCGYCEYQAQIIEFLTDNQRAFAVTYCRAFLEAFEADGDVAIDLDAIASTLTANRPAWVYSEERQQRRIRCASCDATTDIVGDYGACSGCGLRNTEIVLKEALADIRRRYETAKAELTDQNARGAEWGRLLVAGVSAFEGAANDLRVALLRLPYTPRRRQELRQLSFQNLIGAAGCLRDWFAIDLLDGISAPDLEFLRRATNRRHLVAHKSGIVDQEYINSSGDTSVRLGQRVRIDSSDIPRLVRLLGDIGSRFAEGYESLQLPAEPSSQSGRTGARQGSASRTDS